jgi:hypothetical protein
MSDKKIRELERLAKQGDHHAAIALAGELVRQGLVRPIGPCDIGVHYVGVDRFIATHPGVSILLHAPLNPASTWQDVVDFWISDFRERVYGECLHWYSPPERYHYYILHRAFPDEVAWWAPLQHLNTEEIVNAIIGMLRPELRTTPLYQIPFGDRPDPLADAECGSCDGTGYNVGDLCLCVDEDNTDPMVATLLVEAICSDEESE